MDRITVAVVAVVTIDDAFEAAVVDTVVAVVVIATEEGTVVAVVVIATEEGTVVAVVVIATEEGTVVASVHTMYIYKHCKVIAVHMI